MRHQQRIATRALDLLLFQIGFNDKMRAATLELLPPFSPRNIFWGDFLLRQAGFAIYLSLGKNQFVVCWVASQIFSIFLGSGFLRSIRSGLTRTPLKLTDMSFS